MPLDLFGNQEKEPRKKVNKVRNTNAKKSHRGTNNESIDLFLNKPLKIKGTKKGLSKNHIIILKKCTKESSATELRKILGRANATKFRNTIIKPLLENNYLELTIPQSPKSPNQKYRLTGKFIHPKMV